MMLAEVSSVELLEVQLVNAGLLHAESSMRAWETADAARSGRDKHIVNVSRDGRGQFYRNFKTSRHPHTNMAKAALNMMTRTSATDFFNDGIHANSMDTELGHRRTRRKSPHARSSRAAPIHHWTSSTAPPRSSIPSSTA
ncbi:MAG: hypothetical protein IPK54_01615 [Dokdonella sp.]|nr:hypothetical protein [Dokdonella sp.]